MKQMVVTIAIAGILTGCYTLPLYVPTCSHTDQPVYKFERFSDGHHFLFGKDSTMVASVNTKGGVLCGKFEIYYSSGLLKYWGMLDDGGHVVSGKYNNYSLSFSDYNIRSMTIADEQNAQTELVRIMETGIVKAAESTPNCDDVTNQENAMPTLRDCTDPSFGPTIGTIYEHDGRYLRVFQVIEDGVMVAGELNIFVETVRNHVDDEMLSPGRYVYVGPWTYETIEKKLRTIRRFKQVE